MYFFEFIERIKEEGERILKENDPKQTSRINPHSVFWMVAAIAVFYYTDFYIAVRFDPRIHRWVYIYSENILNIHVQSLILKMFLILTPDCDILGTVLA